MRPLLSSLWIACLLALCATLPISCSDDEPDCGSDCGGAGGSLVEECLTNLDCDTGFVCQNGACGNCESDRQCSQIERCDAATQLCQFLDNWGRECELHEQCAVGRYCSQGLCLPGDLVTLCGGHGQCPEGMRCNRKAGPPALCEQDLGCFVNEDCLEEEVCNVGTAKCEIACTPENQADVCAPREICVERRCLECVDDDDCSTGLRCNVDAGKCIGSGCFTDRDCEAGKVCNRRIAFCTEPPPACRSDNECLKDERCDLQEGKCFLRACVPDLDAPNGTQEEATDIQGGDRGDLVVCADEEKWYRISLGASDRVNVLIHPADMLTIHGFEAQLRSDDGQILVEDTVQLKATVAKAGDYYLRVRTRSGQVRYSMSVLISKGTPCANDKHERNDSSTTASTIQAGSHVGLVVCPNDVDWYAVAIPVGKGINVSLAGDGKGNLELELYDGDAESLLDSDTSVATDKSVAASRLGGGRAFIKVLASDKRTESSYGLQISLP